jgi:hypothetical protein
MGQHFPLASGALYIENAIENFSKIDFHGMTKAFGFGQQLFQYLPLGITQIAGIWFSLGIGYFRQASHHECNYST